MNIYALGFIYLCPESVWEKIVDLALVLLGCRFSMTELSVLKRKVD